MTPQHLRAILAELRLSQMALARMLGVPGSTVRRWCSGQHRVPPPVQRLMIVLDIPTVRRRLREFNKKGS